MIKKHFRLKIILMLGMIFIIPLSHGQTDASFLNLTSQDGLAHRRVRMVIKDQTGFIWLATANGLQRFDGYEFQTFKSSKAKNTLKSNVIRVLFVDHHNTLWVGTQGGGLSRYRNGAFETFLHDPKNPESLSHNNVEAIVEDQEGHIWVGTQAGGLCKFQDGKFTRFRSDSSRQGALSHDAVFSLLIDKRGTLWVGTYGGGLNRMNADGTFTVFQHDPNHSNSISGNYIISLAEDRDANLWIGTWQDGLNKFKINVFERINSKNSNLNNNTISSIIEGKEGAMWLGTWGGGISKYENDKFTVYKKHECNHGTLTNNYIEHLFQDNESIIWVSTYAGGVSRLIKHPFHTFRAHTPLNALKNEHVTSVCKTRDGSLWIGTLGGGLHQYKQGKMRVFQDTDAVNSIWCILADHDIVWLGTSAGLIKFQNGRFERYKLPSKHDMILVLHRISENHILVGTWKGAVYRIENQKITTIKKENATHQPIASLLQDSEQRLWIAYQEGGALEQIKNGESILFYHDDNHPKSLLDNNPHVIMQDSKKRIWIGSSNGLCLYDNQKGFMAYTKFYPKLSTQIQSIEEDKLGYLWLGTSDGLLQFHPDKNTLKEYTVHDGLAGDAFVMGASFKDQKNGNLYFGSTNGLSVIDPRNLQRKSRPQKPILNDFQIFNKSTLTQNRFKKPIDQVEEIHLSYQENSFTFVFSSLDYTNIPKEYQYYLDGFEAEYNPPSHRRFATYTNIPYGDYVFKVKQAGAINERTIKIHLEPPFWKLMSFKIFILLLMFICPLVFYQYRIYNARKRENELAEKIREHTFALTKQQEYTQAKAHKLQKANKELVSLTKELRQNTEELNITNQQLTNAEEKMRQLLDNEKEQLQILQQTHKSLVDTQAQLVHSEKMASLGVLTAGIAHEINNPVNFISAGTEVLQQNFKDIAMIFSKYRELKTVSEGEYHAIISKITALEQEIEFDNEVILEVDELLDDIQTGATRITEIVEGLRTFSRLDQDIVKLTNIHESIDSTLVILRTQFRRRIEIIKNYNLKDPYIECHAGKLNQVFMNLIVNSIQAIQGEGKIYISTDLHTHDAIKIEIKDTGKGIPTEIQNRIFEPFFTTKEVGKGTGLGLSISHSIIEKHHGSISFQSEINVGTIATIILPLLQPKPTHHS